MHTDLYDEVTVEEVTITHLVFTKVNQVSQLRKPHALLCGVDTYRMTVSPVAHRSAL